MEGRGSGATDGEGHWEPRSHQNDFDGGWDRVILGQIRKSAVGVPVTTVASPNPGDEASGQSKAFLLGEAGNEMEGGLGHPTKGPDTPRRARLLSRSLAWPSATIANRYNSTTTILLKTPGKDLTEGKRTIGRSMKRCPASLVREMQIETTVSCHLTPIGTATI